MPDKGDEENITNSRISTQDPQKSLILEVSATHYDDEEEAKD